MKDSWNEIEGEFLLMDDQPCEDFDEAETSPMTNEAVPHECPECGGTRYFCANCHSDHHKGGWKLYFFKKTAHKEYLRGRREAVEEFDRWLWENGITHKECAQKLHRFIKQAALEENI